ncbi:hypothetical protein COU12_02485 [Candidatus Jorgensenbacteria bacterium CG10_big_fil_rev_8_21_14_0_10_54_38]|uniref:Uncharacterized protein n=2 Tax=Candidatus Joergenseniibacteriota TaxID=1752739 RepID=A0A2M6WFH7_9BACT|nr:MAG: hypothetical protein COX26_01730 [Candidatus Jorgensenbacteria bacterium CG23_combo_of_CG06-09_8_20_14_all_54_14]PIT91537.1 MAG: hypothetical protein COU12_02485 [Candidatus Jorgensenbacteria bacterium CG10_big_fil_rev_8_21_14_0_10_54_38]
MKDNYTVVRQSKEEEADRSGLKILFFGLTGAALWVLTAYAVQLFFTTAEARYLVGGLAAGFFFLVALILEGFFVKNGLLLRAIAALQGVAPLALFTEYLYPVPSIPLIAGAVLAAAFIAGGVGHGAHVLKNSMKVSFMAVTRAFLPRLLTGVLLFATVLFYLNYFAWGGFSDALGRKLVDQFLKSSEPVVGLVWSGVRLDQTVGEVLARVAEKQLRNMPAVDQKMVRQYLAGDEMSFSRLTPELQKRTVQGAAEALRVALAARLGPIAGDEKVTDAAYRIAAGYATRVSPGTQTIAGVLLALALFLSLRGFFSLFLWLVAFVAYLFFKLLVAVGFARVVTESATREFVIL